jgi:hypothetical protein
MIMFTLKEDPCCSLKSAKRWQTPADGSRLADW